MRFIFDFFGMNARSDAAEKSRFLDVIAENQRIQLELKAALDRIAELEKAVILATDGAAHFIERNAELEKLLKAGEETAARFLGETERARRERDLARLQTNSYRDAVELFATRANASPEELAQLGLGTVIPGDRAAGKPDTFLFGDLEDAKDAVDYAMHNQATAAKFRQLKEHFQRHQEAVTILLDKISKVTRKNRISAADHNELRSLRDTLSTLIRRTI